MTPPKEYTEFRLRIETGQTTVEDARIMEAVLEQAFLAGVMVGAAHRDDPVPNPVRH
jgi:hypothetical protein